MPKYRCIVDGACTPLGVHSNQDSYMAGDIETVSGNEAAAMDASPEWQRIWEGKPEQAPVVAPLVTKGAGEDSPTEE